MITTDELFPATTITSLSPRLLWLATHKLCCYDTNMEGAEDMNGNPEPPWTCCRDEHPEDVLFGHFGKGMDETEACADYARKAGLKLWTEEAGMAP